MGGGGYQPMSFGEKILKRGKRKRGKCMTKRKKGKKQKSRKKKRK
jgi:hypothetical protein